MSALLVVIFVAVGEASHPATVGAAGAAREVLGSDLELQVREMEAVPNDARALSVGTELHAAAVAELTWDAPSHRRARIRFHLERRPGFNERIILFEEGDDVAERGRTVGYAIASMMTAPAEPSVPPGSPSRPESIWPAPGPLVRTEPAPRARTHGAVDAVVAGAMGIEGHAGGWGGGLSGRWYFASSLAARIGIGARAGEVTPAQATSLLMQAAAGIAWVPFAASRTSRFELGVRLDALLLREQLTHFDSDDSEPVVASRWLPGADAAVEGCWLFSPNAGFLGTFGTEVAFGSTDVTINYREVTTIPPIRLVLQAGIRATF